MPIGPASGQRFSPIRFSVTGAASLHLSTCRRSCAAPPTEKRSGLARSSTLTQGPFLDAGRGSLSDTAAPDTETVPTTSQPRRASGTAFLPAPQPRSRARPHGQTPARGSDASCHPSHAPPHNAVLQVLPVSIEFLTNLVTTTLSDRAHSSKRRRTSRLPRKTRTIWIGFVSGR